MATSRENDEDDDTRDYAQEFPLTVITIVRSDRTRVDTRDRLMGRGVQLPSGMIVMDWRTESYPPADRLDSDHQSIYYNLDDLEQGTGGDVIVERKV